MVDYTKKLEELTQAANTFLSKLDNSSHTFHQVRHDIIAPTAQVKGLVELHNLGALSPDEEQLIDQRIHYFSNILESLKHPNKTIDFDFKHKIDKAVSFYLQDSGIDATINKNYKDVSLEVNANPMLVQEAVHNLLRNIDRYAADTSSIDVDLQEITSNELNFDTIYAPFMNSDNIKSQHNYAVVSVKDYGSNPALNIKDDELSSKKFIFSQGQSGGKGMGDGLYASKSNIEKYYNGIMDVEYTIPQKKIGSDFKIYLPVAKEK